MSLTCYVCHSEADPKHVLACACPRALCGDCNHEGASVLCRACNAWFMPPTVNRGVFLGDALIVHGSPTCMRVLSTCMWLARGVIVLTVVGLIVMQSRDWRPT